MRYYNIPNPSEPLMRAYEGLLFNRYLGAAVFAGPSLFRHATDSVWLSGAANF